MLEDEAALNLDDLEAVFHLARADAMNAFKAASLLHFEAGLAESWTGGWSRPHAIFARHSAAVRDGSPRVKPATPTARFPFAEDVLTASDVKFPHVNRAERPKCAAVAKSTGSDCARFALAIGPDKHLSHCYGHFNADERAQYDAYQQQLADLQHRQRGAAVDRFLEESRTVAADWVERRRGRLN